MMTQMNIVILLSSERDNQSSGLGDSLLAVDYGLEELSQQIVERLLARIHDGEYGADNDHHNDDKNVKRRQYDNYASFRPAVQRGTCSSKPGFKQYNFEND